jgi:hypothetical protein
MLTTHTTRRMDETHVSTDLASLFKPQMTILQTEKDFNVTSNSSIGKIDCLKKDSDLLLMQPIQT